MTKFIRPNKDAAPDMTPMLDIVFILIIFFVVTASFTLEPGLSVNRPQPGPTPPLETNEEGLLLQLASNQRILYQGYPVNMNAAIALMKKFHVEHESQIIVVKLEAGAKLGQLVTLLDRGKLAGLPKGSIAVV